jgi:hypothetical protein
MAPAIYYIDFGQDGGDSDAERQPTHGADVNGNYWNNVIAPYGQATTINAGTTVNLVNSHNEATNGVITLVNKASSNGGNTNCGLPDPNPELVGDLAIGTATNDYLFLDDNTGNQGHFRFSGLYAEKAYKFYIFGTRKTDDVRGGTFYIHGQNQFNDYLQNSGADIGTDITITIDYSILVS